MSWDKIKIFMGENRIYLVMISFILATEIFLAVSPPVETKKDKLVEKKRSHRILTREEEIAQEERIKELLSRNRPLAFAITASTFATGAALMVGLFLGVGCIARKLGGRDILPAYGSPPDVGWRIIDILRVIVIFYFFGYLIQWAEATLFNMRKADDILFTVLNAMVMDFIGLAVVLYFVLNKFKLGLAGLGVTFNNIKRNIKIALGGYMVILPVLAVIMVVVLVCVKAFSYEPPETKALEMLYDTDRPKLLLILTVLVTIVGPIAEELFFRGFAYPVFRRKMGVRNAILLVSVIFAMLHMNIISFFPILALGILLAYLYEKTGSLIPSITVHVVHNTAVVFFVYLYKLIALPK